MPTSQTAHVLSNVEGVSIYSWRKMAIETSVHVPLSALSLILIFLKIRSPFDMPPSSTIGHSGIRFSVSAQSRQDSDNFYFGIDVAKSGQQRLISDQGQFGHHLAEGPNLVLTPQRQYFLLFLRNTLWFAHHSPRLPRQVKNKNKK